MVCLLIPVHSSDIAAVDYNEADHSLYIRFHSGGLYKYFNVPDSVFYGLLNAASKGRYLHAYIRHTYSYIKY